MDVAKVRAKKIKTATFIKTVLLRSSSPLPIYQTCDSSRIGLVSFLYVVTIATGVLSHYPDLPVRFFIDWESPPNREYTTHG
jgi:hypothetical protein